MNSTGMNWIRTELVGLTAVECTELNLSRLTELKWTYTVWNENEFNWKWFACFELIVMNLFELKSVENVWFENWNFWAEIWAEISSWTEISEMKCSVFPLNWIELKPELRPEISWIELILLLNVLICSELKSI